MSEADLKDSLDSGQTNVNQDEDSKKMLTEFEKRLEIDYQLQRAIDLVKGISLYNLRDN